MYPPVICIVSENGHDVRGLIEDSEALQHTSCPDFHQVVEKMLVSRDRFIWYTENDGTGLDQSTAPFFEVGEGYCMEVWRLGSVGYSLVVIYQEELFILMVYIGKCCIVEIDKTQFCSSLLSFVFMICCLTNKKVLLFCKDCFTNLT